MGAKTPDFISTHIVEFCRQVSPDAMPVYVQITPEPGCEVNDCFQCIRNKVSRSGGRIQVGWSIWEWPKVYVEAEHHGVYEPRPGSPWLDITPALDPAISRRLFLPDNNAVYDFDHEGMLRDNKRHALSDDPLIQEFFSAAQSRVELLNTVPGVGMVSMDVETHAKISAAGEKQRQLSYALGMKHTTRNEPCFCGSRQKFKRCHGEARRSRHDKH